MHETRKLHNNCWFLMETFRWPSDLRTSVWSFSFLPSHYALKWSVMKRNSDILVYTVSVFYRNCTCWKASKFREIMFRNSPKINVRSQISVMVYLQNAKNQRFYNTDRAVVNCIMIFHAFFWRFDNKDPSVVKPQIDISMFIWKIFL